MQEGLLELFSFFFFFFTFWAGQAEDIDLLSNSKIPYTNQTLY